MFFLFSVCLISRYSVFYFFFFNDTATTEIYTLSLHDALPIWIRFMMLRSSRGMLIKNSINSGSWQWMRGSWQLSCKCRSEEHTSELQSLRHLVCRLLLEKKKKKKYKKICSARKK